MKKIMPLLMLMIIISLFSACKKEAPKSDQELLEIAISSVDPSYCGKIKTVNGKVSKDGCYGYLALMTKNFQLCNEISKQSGEGSKERCKKIVLSNSK